MPNDTPTIDCQVHAYDRNDENNYRAVLAGPATVTGEEMVAAMDAVGVDGALLISPFTIYGYDSSYCEGVAAQYPDRFGLIAPFDPNSPTVGADVEAWAERPGVVGARVVLNFESVGADHAGVDAIMAAGGAAGIPINVLCWQNLPELRAYAQRHPDTQLVIDHVGLQQPFQPPPPDDPWADIDQVIALAEFEHVAIKISGACTLSHEPFPYSDIWEPLGRIFEAYGLARCLWGTDWTRATNLLTFEQGVEAFRQTDTLSDDERATLMGGALQQIYGWSPGASETSG